MALESPTLTLTPITTSPSPYQLNPSQTLRATTALLRKIRCDDAAALASSTKKPSLLADASHPDTTDETPIWLVLTTKKHIIDKKRLKPGKIALPHPYLNASDEALRVCLITADPQRKYKDLITDPSFPPELQARVKRVLGMTKLKAKYKSFEQCRQLAAEYDVFLADDRVVTYLPQVLGKTFYKGGSKRPVPVTLEGKRQSVDEKGNKRARLSEGGTKVAKQEVKPMEIAREIEKALGSALVHLAPSTTTAVKVGRAGMEPGQVQANVEAVVEGLVAKYVPKQWKGVRSVHIKGPETAALPIWMAEELWEDEGDVLDEPLPVKEKSKKRKRGALAEAGTDVGAVIEVPGPDGKMRRLEKPHSVKRSRNDDAGKAQESAESEQTKAVEKAERAQRKEALKKQKAEAKAAINGIAGLEKTKEVVNGDAPKNAAARKSRVKAADLI